MAETGGSSQYKRDLDVRDFKRRQNALKEINKPKQSLISRLRNILLGTAVGAVGGAGAEATVHPVQTVAENVADVVTNQAESFQRAGETIASFYSESEEIENYNKETIEKISGRVPLSPEESFFEQVQIVPWGKNLEETEKMRTDGTPVEVWDFPGAVTPTGQKTNVIDRLEQGTIVYSAISVLGGRLPEHLIPGTPTDSQQIWYAILYRPKDAGPNEPLRMAYLEGQFVMPLTPAAKSVPQPAQ